MDGEIMSKTDDEAREKRRAELTKALDGMSAEDREDVVLARERMRLEAAEAALQRRIERKEELEAEEAEGAERAERITRMAAALEAHAKAGGGTVHELLDVVRDVTVFGLTLDTPRLPIEDRIAILGAIELAREVVHRCGSSMGTAEVMALHDAISAIESEGCSRHDGTTPRLILDAILDTLREDWIEASEYLEEVGVRVGFDVASAIGEKTEAAEAATPTAS